MEKELLCKKNYIDLTYLKNLLRYPIYVNKVYIVISRIFFSEGGGGEELSFHQLIN